jgi:UPF0288 family protein (methanogenesis marker protein 3)
MRRVVFIERIHKDAFFRRVFSLATDKEGPLPFYMNFYYMYLVPFYEDTLPTLLISLIVSCRCGLLA